MTARDASSPVTKIINCRLLRDHKIVEDDVLYLRDGKIIDAQDHFYSHGEFPEVVIDAQGLLVAPGFIDVQINGAFGVDFSYCRDKEEYKKGLLCVTKGLLNFGTTSFLPTLVSSTPDVYQTVLPLLEPRRGDAISGAEILGVHVEGPYLAHDKNGAHVPANLGIAPGGFVDMCRLYGTSSNAQPIRMITLAPEVEGMIDSIESLNKAGVAVSIGHSSASTAQAEAAVEKGARCITHLFNAMRQFHHRDPGIIGLLGTTRMRRPYYGIICDGVHVHPNSVKIAYESHPEGAVLVTDAVSAMGLPPGEYALGGMHVRKVNDTRVEVLDTGRLAGSVIDMNASIKNFAKFTGCSIVEALEAATLHPAELLEIADRKGTLSVGADADLVFLNDSLDVVRCFVRGQEAIIPVTSTYVVQK